MSAPRRWLRFAAGELEVMVAASAFRRTLPVPSPLPDELELAGERYPLIDLGALAGTAANGSAPALLLVLADDGARLAVPATEVSGALEAAAADLAPLPWPYDEGLPWCAGVLVPSGEGARPILALDLAALARAATGGALVAGEAG